LTGKGIKLESVRTSLVFRPRQAQIAARISAKHRIWPRRSGFPISSDHLSAMPHSGAWKTLWKDVFSMVFNGSTQDAWMLLGSAAAIMAHRTVRSLHAARVLRLRRKSSASSHYARPAGDTGGPR